MELMGGGELRSLMHPKTGSDCMPEDTAKFYASGIIDGLSYMHRNGYVYRDLKPAVRSFMSQKK